MRILRGGCGEIRLMFEMTSYEPYTSCWGMGHHVIAPGGGGGNARIARGGYGNIGFWCDIIYMHWYNTQAHATFVCVT